MITLRRVARNYGLVGAAAREAVRGRQRQRQAPQLVVRHRERRTCSSRATTPHDNMQFLFFCCGGAARRSSGTRTCCACRSRTPATTTGWAPTRRRRRSSACSWATSSRTCSSRSRRAARPRRASRAGCSGWARRRCRTCPSTRATATARRPFAFTGNKFEFRALGSVAEHLVAGHGAQHDRRRVDRRDGAPRWRRRPAKGTDLRRRAARAARRGDHTASSASSSTATTTRDEWQQEAEKRGLLNMRTTMDALPELVRREERRRCSRSTAC